MKKLLYFIVFFLLLSCNTKESKKEFVAPSDTVINGVVKALIEQGNFPVLKSGISIPTGVSIPFSSIPIEIDLKPIDILTSEEFDGSATQPGKNVIYIGELLSLKKEKSLIFTKVDSIYFLWQAQNTEQINIDTSLFNGLNSTASYQYFEKKYSKKIRRYYSISKPLFSLDHKKVYVELDLNCNGECGHGVAYILEKQNGKWVIIESDMRWIG